MVTSSNYPKNDSTEDLPNFSDEEDFVDDVTDQGFLTLFRIFFF
jgi:hypothetical protein